MEIVMELPIPPTADQLGKTNDPHGFVKLNDQEKLKLYLIQVKIYATIKTLVWFIYCGVYVHLVCVTQFNRPLSKPKVECQRSDKDFV